MAQISGGKSSSGKLGRPPPDLVRWLPSSSRTTAGAVNSGAGMVREAGECAQASVKSSDPSSIQG